MRLILSFVLSLLLINPVWSCTPKPYTAVYCCPGFEQFWGILGVDYFEVAYSWDHFDDFLRRVKKEAAGRHIDLDLEVHGDQGLSIQYQDGRTGNIIEDTRTMGFVVNHIETILAGEDITLIAEACFAGSVYKNTIRGNKKGENCNHVPAFPIYGGSYNHMNLNNFIFIQYKTKCHRYFEDLREYEYKKGPSKRDMDENSPDHKRMSALYHILAPLYVPE